MPASPLTNSVWVSPASTARHALSKSSSSWTRPANVTRCSDASCGCIGTRCVGAHCTRRARGSSDSCAVPSDSRTRSDARRSASVSTTIWLAPATDCRSMARGDGRLVPPVGARELAGSDGDAHDELDVGTAVVTEETAVHRGGAVERGGDARELDDDAVAEAGDLAPAVAGAHVAQDPEVRVPDGLGLLATQRCGETGRAHEVGDEDRAEVRRRDRRRRVGGTGGDRDRVDLAQALQLTRARRWRRRGPRPRTPGPSPDRCRARRRCTGAPPPRP